MSPSAKPSTYEIGGQSRAACVTFVSITWSPPYTHARAADFMPRISFTAFSPIRPPRCIPAGPPFGL